jgi:hypothetical protein
MSSDKSQVSAMERKIQAGVKKRQALAETLDPKLTVKTGDATKKRTAKK